ncbi:MAG: CDP-glycerol glycerophosphotransferase family protein [Clostridia bacterium]|nr:CDP-glycerol glycerophosphotransferase family protein [Clostridia bacterium]
MREKLSVFCFNLIKFITALLPFKNNIIFESNPIFADNAFAVYKEFLKRGYNKKYKLIWLINGNNYSDTLPYNVSVVKRDGSLSEKLIYYWILSRSKFIIDSNNFVKKVHRRQIRIHLKHGLPIKDASQYTKTIGELDVLCVPSDYWINVSAKEHNVDPSVIKPLGFPRNDVLVPHPHEFKTIMWMPTFRKNSLDTESDIHFDFNSIMPLGLPFISNIESLQKINELFKTNNAYLLVRLHPAQDLSGISLSEMSNVKICNDEFIKSHNTSLYKILTYTDALISDYSSIYYDYLLLNKPIALATFDFEHYKNHNGIIVKNYDEFKKAFPSVFVESFDDLIAFFTDIFNDNPDAYKCAEAKERYMKDCDSHSAEKIVDYIANNYKL